MRLLTGLALSLLASGALAEDVLISKRVATEHLQKRGTAEETFDITFFHINDVHAHLDQFSSAGTDCTNPERGCYGGYSRVKTVLDESRPAQNNSLFLDAGDEFQGTLYYNFYKGWKTAETLNQIGVDAMTLGNHEFDDGDDLLGDFLNNITFPVVCANLQSAHPVLNTTVKPYTLFPQYELAVIGVSTPDIVQLSNPGPNTTFSNVATAVQTAIDEIHTVHPTITRIVALTHIGYEADLELAQQTTGLSLIIGGHSHTLLGNMTGAQGAYPTIATNSAGHEVFVVTAYRWGEYLGYIDITYAADGSVLAYRGAPVHLTNTTAQDPELQAQVDAWRQPFQAYATEVVGFTETELVQATCQAEECTMGNVMADAMLLYGQGVDPDLDFAIINAGGVRAAIEAGNVTRGEVIGAFPFGNALVQLEYTGQEIWDVLEGIVSGVNQINGATVTSFLQLSTGIQVSYDPAAAVGDRLVSVTVGEAALDLSATYKIITLDYLAGGGDNFFQATTDYVTLDLQADVLEAYFKEQSPINAVVEGRISVV